MTVKYTGIFRVMGTDQLTLRRRWLQIGVRIILLVSITLLCVGLAVRDYRARELHSVVQAIGTVYGQVSFMDDTAFLAHFVLGKTIGDIRQIDVPVSRDSVNLLDTLKSIPNLERLNHNTWYQTDIDRLAAELPNVEFGDSQVGGFLPLDTSIGH